MTYYNIPNFNIDDVQRFWSNIQIPKKLNDCWIWNGHKLDSGYGQFYTSQRMWRAHRFSYMSYNGIINSDVFICHSCDNKICVNPNHLWEGNHAKNMQDMVIKNRSVSGDYHFHCKISDSKAIDIIHKIKSNYYTNTSQIIRDYNISFNTLYRILNNKRKNVKLNTEEIFELKHKLGMIISPKVINNIKYDLKMNLINTRSKIQSKYNLNDNQIKKIFFDELHDYKKYLIDSKNTDISIIRNIIEDVQYNRILKRSELALKYNVSKDLIQAIFTGKHSNNQLPKKELKKLNNKLVNESKKLSEEDVKLIKYKYSNYSITMLSIMFNVGKTTISNIKKCNTWRNI